jgi:hypothetical protein
MANTEGISDEDMMNLLSLDDDSHSTMPRGLLQRQRMMDDFEIGESRPAAKVIRSSKPPTIKSSKVGQGKQNCEKGVDKPSVTDEQLKNTHDGVKIEETDINHRPAPVLKSNFVQERKISTNENENNPPKKMSRFKMKRQQEAATDVPPTNGGFPSFDIPIGSLTRKGKKTATNVSIETKTNDSIDITQGKLETNRSVSEAESMIANMSAEDIQESVAEIESILSPEIISFLKNRKKKGNETKKNDRSFKKVSFEETIDKQSERSSSTQEIADHDKKRVSDTLSKIRTEEELDALYEKVMGESFGLEDNNPDEKELEQASKLLRSTSARQRLLGAKTVCSLLGQRLEELSKDGFNFPQEDANDYPAVLPVALRCLLDVPSPQKHMELISYVFQSISILVILFTNSSHRVDCSRFVESSDRLPSIIYQREYMRDSVPMPSPSDLYLMDNINSSQERNLGNGCYATNATSESAKIDAKAFYNDPSWTLLSKMRVIPCVSCILENMKKSIHHSDYRKDSSITSICSIMAMLSLRSPGAGVAIAQHKVIIPTLSHLGLSPGSGEMFVVNTAIAFPILQFLEILSRQSRACAKAVSTTMGDIICILSSSAESVEDIELQRWCIILWRTLLRYGIGISYLSTILQISIPSLSSAVHDRKSLAPDYLSAYAVICECVKIKSQQKKLDCSPLGIELNEDDENSLTMSGMWLSAHAKSCYNNLVASNATFCKYISSMLYFISSFFAAASINQTGKISDEQNSSSVVHIPIISLENIISVLENISDTKEFSESLKMAFSVQNSTLIEDAVASSLVESFFNTFNIVNEKIAADREYPEESKINPDTEMAILILEQNICSKIISSIEYRPFGTRLNLVTSSQHLAQEKWKSSAQAMIIKFILSSKCLSDDLKTMPIIHMIQSMAIQLVGKLQAGQESTAALLLSQDLIFTVFDEHKNSIVSSATQNMMLNQLCSSLSSQHQLDHSFKLNGRPGIWSTGKGHFDVESLRSEVDQMNTGSSITEQVKLPFGKDWIWNIFSSHASLVNKNDESFAVVTQTMIETIQYLYYAERVRMDFTKDMSAGSKLYFLLNCILSPETVLRHEQFQFEYLKLLNVYSNEFLLDEKACGQDFVITCYKHSKHFIEKTKDKSEEKFNRILELFFGDTNLSSNELALSSKDLKAVDEFVADICNAFTEFGAQYDFFIQSIRMLLMRGMSFRVRNGVLSNLKDVLHLLTTEFEVSDETNSSLLASLQPCLLGGHRVVDNSPREHAAYIDTLINGLAMKNVTNIQRRDFFYLLAVATIARELAAFALRCECGTTSLKRKLSKLDGRIWSDISKSAVECDKLKCADPSALTRIVMSFCFISITHDNEIDEDFDTVVAKIRSNNQ